MSHNQVNSTPRLEAFSLQKWIEENRELLKPPVGNRLLYSGEFKVGYWFSLCWSLT